MIKLSEQNPLYVAIARAAGDIQTVREELQLRSVSGPDYECDIHGECLHYMSTLPPFANMSACRQCVNTSRFAVQMGRRGGAKGGKVMTDKKRESFKKNAAKRWEKKL